MPETLIRSGITLLSGVDPVRRAERIADAVSVQDRTLYFCPSPLYGYGLERFLSRLEKQAPASAVLCIESDSELYELALKNIDVNPGTNVRADGKKLLITNISDPRGLCALVREKWGARAFRRIETIRFTGGWQLFPDLYASLFEALRGEIAVDWSNALTLARMGRLYIRNALRNLVLIKDFSSISELSFGSLPVLVLGAGPSLDAALDALEMHYAHFLRTGDRPFRIICVDTCLAALKDRDIVPDLAVILESQHWNLRDFIGCCGWNVKAAVDFSALPQSSRLLGGQGFLFMTPWTHLRIFERLKDAGLLPSVVPPLGSVGLTAVEIALRLTTGKIYCAGLDFSFTLDRYHGRGTPGHRNTLNTHNRFGGLLNTAAFGESAARNGLNYTNPVMRRYRELFEREFGNDPRVVNFDADLLSRYEELIEQEYRKKDLAQSHCLQANRDAENILIDFIKSEIERLNELRNMLIGRISMDQERLSVLIDECDYLWAHFPDYAGLQGQKGCLPDLSLGSESAASFLNRVRVEIDPMLKLMERAEHQAK